MGQESQKSEMSGTSVNSLQTKHNGGWNGKSLVSIHDLSEAQVQELFSCADICRNAVTNFAPSSVLQCCNGKVMASMFYEPSTRTSCSFNAAMMRLGGQVLQVNASTSSVKKGETLQDSMRSIECYSDLIVLRHPEKGSVAKAATVLRKPIVNAGDGDGEHPTQALLDLYTILRERKGSVEGLSVTMVGDLKYGRTTHSLAKLLARHSVKLNYVSPAGLEMPKEIVDHVKSAGLAKQQSLNSLQDVLGETDVLYVTRVQKERFESLNEYNKMVGKFVITADLLSRFAKDDITVMHPLPRVGEITEDVDCLPGAAYFRQMENGMYVRMAIIAKILNVL